MDTKGTLYEFAQVEMLLGVLPKDLKAKAIIKLELDPQEPETFKYDSLHKYILDKYITADALTLLDTDTAHIAPEVSSYSIPTGDPLPQMPSVTSTSQENEPSTATTTAVITTPNTETTATEKQEETIDTKMDNMMKAFEAWTVQLTKATYPRPQYTRYQMARAHANQADNPPMHPLQSHELQMNAPSGPGYYRPTMPNYQQYPRQGLGPCIYCDDLGHIRTFCPDVRTHQEQGITHLNACGRLTLGPCGGRGGEISGYQPE